MWAGQAIGADQSAATVQYRSPEGIEYRSLPETDAIRSARAALAADPRNIARVIDLGVAESGARQFREAIITFTRGLEIDPNHAMLLRWRGHRYLSVREFDRAVADFTRGASIDPGIYGIWYHLGVIQYLRGEFTAAAGSFAKAQPIAPDPGELAASTDWLWMSLMRAGRRDEAKAMLDRRPDNKPVTNAYTRRLQLYRGEIGPDAVITAEDKEDVQIATLAYGLGNWYLLRGDKAQARALFEQSVKSGGWPGFAFMAAEADLTRLQAPEPTAHSTALASEALWRADLEFFAREFARVHVDFQKLYPRDRFDRELSAIVSALPTSRDTDVVLALMRLVAGAGVGHTYVRFPTPPSPIAFRRLPLALNWFADGLVVTGASEAYRDAAGQRVELIGRMTPAQLQEAIAPYVAFENIGWLKQQTRTFMTVPEVLRLVGAIEGDGPVPVRLARDNGTTFTLNVEPRPWQDRQLVTAVSVLGIPPLLAERDPARAYWSEYLPEFRAVYIRYNRCQDDPAQPFAAFTKELFRQIDAEQRVVERVVIDLRSNGGGDSRVIQPLLDALRARKLTGRNRLVVLTGPATFSSALMAAVTLRDDLRALLVGEPPGERPNSYGEVRQLALPNSQLVIQYSTKFFRMDRHSDLPALEPHVVVTRSVEDFLAGRDPALEAALRF